MNGPTVKPWKTGTRDKRLRSWFVKSASLAQCLLLAPVCRAEGLWSASIGATNDYVLRGVSQTYDSAAIQLGANYQSPVGWFVGAWGSNVNPYPNAGAAVELDLYAGLTRPIGSDFSARVAYTHYAYLDDPRPAHYDYEEVSVSLAYLDRMAVTLSVLPDLSSYSDIGFARREASGSLEVTGRWPVWRDLSVSAGAGYYDLQRLFGVSYWAGNIGSSYVYRRLTLEVARYFAQGTLSRLYDGQSANGVWSFSAEMRF